MLEEELPPPSMARNLRAKFQQLEQASAGGGASPGGGGASAAASRPVGRVVIPAASRNTVAGQSAGEKKDKVCGLSVCGFGKFVLFIIRL